MTWSSPPGAQRGFVWCCDMTWCPVFDAGGRHLGVLDTRCGWKGAWSRCGDAVLGRHASGRRWREHLRPGSTRDILRTRAAHCTLDTMRKSYDFSNARPNPYAKRMKKQVTIRLDEETIAYFKGLAENLSMPYQTLINLYLRDCAQTRKRLNIQWTDSTKAV